MPELSVVIPLHNEEENVVPLMAAVRAALAGIDYELLLIDDGSEDNTSKQILENADQHTQLVELEKNYGQSAAIRAGIEHTSGEYIAILDGDLQNDPADIPAMLTLLKAGEWDVVAGNRKNRQDGFFFRKIPSRIANALIRSLTGVRLKDYGCSLRLFKRDVAIGLKLHGEYHRFIPVLAYLQGARITQVDVKHHPRIHGRSKYGLGRTFRVIRDLALMANLERQQSKKTRLSVVLAMTFFLLLLATGIYLSAVAFDHKPVNIIELIAGIVLFAAVAVIIITVYRAKHKAARFYAEQKETPYKIRRLHQFRN